MDYYKIGQAIRRFRKAQGLSQEELAEKVGISTTHMSHIETGNTKLSLPVLVRLAEVLDVQTDSILFAQPSKKEQTLGALQAVAESCTQEELQIILDVIKSLKISLEKNRYTGKERPD